MTLSDLLDKLSEARKRFGDVEIVFVERRLYFGRRDTRVGDGLLHKERLFDSIDYFYEDDGA